MLLRAPCSKNWSAPIPAFLWEPYRGDIVVQSSCVKRIPKSCCPKSVFCFYGKNLRQDERKLLPQLLWEHSPKEQLQPCLDANRQHSPPALACRSPERPSPACCSAAPLTRGGYPLVVQRGSVVGHRPGW